MKKFLPIILSLALVLGCQKNPLIGKWERYGDGAAGTVVEVENAGNLCTGRLVKVAGVLNELGFYENDIKWRDISPMSSNRWKGQDLIKQLDTEGNLVNVEYKDVYFTLTKSNELEIRWFAREEEFVGTIQRWKRIP
jgi:hypothetical protein